MVRGERHGIKAKTFNRWLIVLAVVIIFVSESIYGAYNGIVNYILPGDALSRVANAYYVLFVNPPRYSSMGLIWNPLPSTLEIPLVALSKLWRPLASRGVAGNIVSALFAGLTAGVLLNTFNKFKIAKPYAIFITLCYCLHPYIFYYGSNGMSESMFTFFLIYCICCLTLWFKFGTSKYIIKMAFGIVGGFLMRYEAIPLALGLGLCVITNIIFNKKEDQYWSKGSKKERYFYIEGTLFMFFTPIIYAIIVWIIYCLVITGNPLFFLNSGYSNAGQSVFAIGSSSLLDLVNHVAYRAIPFLVFFFAIVIVRIVQRRIFKYDFLCLLFLVGSLLAFHVLMYWRGTSYGWLRYFFYSLPTCIAWLPYEMSTYQNDRVGPEQVIIKEDILPVWHKSGKNIMHLAQIILPISLVVSVFLTANVFKDISIADQEFGSTGYQESLEIADYINEKLPDKIILTDIFTTYNVALNVDSFSNLVVSSSPNFKECVKDPVRNGIDYLLVPDPNGVSNYDSINVAYPGLYAHGTDWCKEEADFGNFKLFRVTG